MINHGGVATFGIGRLGKGRCGCCMVRLLHFGHRGDGGNFDLRGHLGHFGDFQLNRLSVRCSCGCDCVRIFLLAAWAVEFHTFTVTTVTVAAATTTTTTAFFALLARYVFATFEAGKCFNVGSGEINRGKGSGRRNACCLRDIQQFFGRCCFLTLFALALLTFTALTFSFVSFTGFTLATFTRLACLFWLTPLFRFTRWARLARFTLRRLCVACWGGRLLGGGFFALFIAVATTATAAIAVASIAVIPLAVLLGLLFDLNSASNWARMDARANWCFTKEAATRSRCASGTQRLPD